MWAEVVPTPGPGEQPTRQAAVSMLPSVMKLSRTSLLCARPEEGGQHRERSGPRFDSPRAVQLRLPGFDLPALGELGRKARDLYAGAARNPERLADRVDDAYLDELAQALTGSLGGRIGIAPRLYLRKLVADVLDRVDEFAEFDPRAHYALTLRSAELTEPERSAVTGAGDVALDVDP